MMEGDVDADVDVRDPDEKSIMTYVAQFLQYSRDQPVPEEEMQVWTFMVLNKAEDGRSSGPDDVLIKTSQLTAVIL